MNILWVTNYLLPEATSLLICSNEQKGTGGWILALAHSLCSKTNISLSIASITPLVKELTVIQGETITYYAIPYGKGDCRYNKEYEVAFRKIGDAVNPCVVHIHGTEYPHSLAALNALSNEKTIITIQGLVSVCSTFYLAGISRRYVYLNYTFHDIIRGSLIKEQRDMMIRGNYEIQLIKKAKHIGGRTSWDKGNVWSINPKVSYYSCGEILREEFYSGVWNYSTCKPHSIFISNAGYPIKGLHKVLQALLIVKSHYPDVQLRVAGRDITFSEGKLKDKLRITCYGRIIKRFIRNFDLQDNISFLGELNANEMKNEYLRSNVFVCPSAIENSPNSLGEAQILGVPCIASYVGGVMDMMKGDEDHLYRYDETGILAAKICDLFGQEDRVDTSKMRSLALIRHDVDRVTNEIIDIYTSIASKYNKESV